MRFSRFLFLSPRQMHEKLWIQRSIEKGKGLDSYVLLVLTKTDDIGSLYLLKGKELKKKIYASSDDLCIGVTSSTEEGEILVGQLITHLLKTIPPDKISEVYRHMYEEDPQWTAYFSS